MPSKQSTDQAGWARYIAAAEGLDRAWTRNRLCTSDDGTPHEAWVVPMNGPGSGPVPVTIGRMTVMVQSAELARAALMVCNACPVQWSCARFGIQSEATAATYSVPIDDLQWLGRQPDWGERLDEAEAAGVSVQAMVRELMLTRPGGRRRPRQRP